MSKYLVQYTPAALAGMQMLAKTASKASLKAMKQLLTDLAYHDIGLPLEDLADLKLNGCRKIYFGETSQYRIVYEILEGGRIDIVEVLAIGRREGYEAYIDAHQARH